MQNTENKEIWTALYARLSMDDGNVGESMSIGSQKAILKRKTEEMGIHRYKFYVEMKTAKLIQREKTEYGGNR